MGCLKASVPAGSVQSAKGEASDEDEETEYFDAMEDAPAFITVTADPKHHRYHPLPAWGCGKGWVELLFLQQPLPPGHSVGMSSKTSLASVQRSILPPLLLNSWSKAEDGPQFSEAGEEGQVSAGAVGELSPLPLS